MPLPVIPSGGVAGPVVVPSVAARTPALELRATWRPQRYERIANGDFATDTTGWSVAAGINEEATSITRVTTDGPPGSSTCASLVVPAEEDSGCNYDLGASPYYADAACSTLMVLRLWLKRVSGGRRAWVILGSQASAAAWAILEVDLLDEWQEYLLPWRPQAKVTDAQVAVMTGNHQAMTMRIGGVRLYSPLASQVDNGSFLTDTDGWAIDGSLIAGAATSLTRIVGDGIAGLCAQLVTDGDADDGADFALGDRLFRADMTHRLRVGLRHVAGSDQVRLRIGSLGTAGDRADATVTAGTQAWHVLDWTPSADRTDVVVSVAAGEAAAMTVRISEVEVYEALDDLSPDSLDLTRGAAFDGSDVAGSMGGSLPDISATYTDWNPASPLAGFIRPKVVPLLARATHDGLARGLGWGRLATTAPDPYQKHMHFTTGDGLRDLASARISRPFRSELTYAQARDEALTAAGVGAWQRSLDFAGPESMPFFDGTDTPVGALQYLTDLNGATGSIHVAEPSPHANVGWVYRTTNRAALTDAGAQWSIVDDSRGPLPGVESRDDGLVTSARRTFRGYEMLRPLGPLYTMELPWDTEPAPDVGYGILAWGGDPALFPGLKPYLVFTRPDFGSYEPPEPEEVITVRRVRGKKRRRRQLRWTDPIFPLLVPAGTSRVLTVDFSVMVEGLDVRGEPSSADVSIVAEPAHATITVRADASDVTLEGLALIGRPWLPVDEQEVVLSIASAAIGGREPAELPGSDTYVAGRAGAEGIIRYHLWRYGESRLRPVVKDALHPARMLGMRVGDRVVMSQSRYLLGSTRFAARAITHRISRPDAIDWHTEYTLEQLPPDAGPWVVIGGGPSRGIGSTAETAY